MGNMLEVYYKVSLELKSKYNIRSNFYISDFKNYKKFIKKYPEFEKNQNPLFEWDLTSAIKNKNIDLSFLNELEKKYFENSSILEPFSSDRRIYLGPKSKFFQDYNKSYNYDEILKILIHSVKKIENFFSINKFDHVIGFTTATFAEILIYKMCEEKNIKFYHLRHTKIGKNYTFSQDLYEHYSNIRETYNNLQINTYNDEKILNLIEKFKKKGVEYEGRVGSDLSLINLLKNFPLEFLTAIFNYLKYFNFKKDNHYKINFLKIYLYDRVLRVFNSKFQLLYLNKYFTKITHIDKSYNYIFYPLHAEPEISVSIFSPFYENQIEVIRNVCKNLPANFKLIVKEHPRNIGRRKSGYYKKICQIPNVVLVNPFESSRKVILLSKLSIVLSGFIAFETIMLNKPVLSLGNAMYNMLPKSMINNTNNIKDIFKEIKFCLTNFKYDEKIIYKYLKSILINSDELDLYTVLLKKKGRSGGEIYSEELYNQNINKIYKMISKLLNVNS